MHYRSQKGQDRWVIEEVFRFRRGGYFLDCGAFDGLELSNTYALETELGWTGLCVEAHAGLYERLVRNRRCPCAHACVDAQPGQVEFRRYEALSGIVGEDTDNSLRVRREQILA